MKMNMKQMPKYSMTQYIGHMLRMAWRTLKRVPFTCMVRTDSPSHRSAVTALAGPMLLWNGCQAVIDRSVEGALC